jgi:hypothetical protein
MRGVDGLPHRVFRPSKMCELRQRSENNNNNNNNKHAIIIFIFAAGHTAQQNEVQELGTEHAAKPVNTSSNTTQYTARNLHRLHQSFPLTCIAVLFCSVPFSGWNEREGKGEIELCSRASVLAAH